MEGNRKANKSEVNLNVFHAGVIRYKGAKIQLLDLPGIIEGAKDGKGRGRQVIAGIQSLHKIIVTSL